MFIVFEGIDGAGTTTQAAKTARYLRQKYDRADNNAKGHQTVIETREPTDLPIGRLIRQRLASKFTDINGVHKINLAEACNALLFAADRLDHLNTRVIPTLRAGHPVVCDRYVYSSLAYQSISLENDWISTINQYAVNDTLCQPDLCFYLKLPANIAKQRRVARGGQPERYDLELLQQRISRQYDAMFDSETIFNAKNLHIIDARPSVNDVFESIRTVLDASMDK